MKRLFALIVLLALSIAAGAQAATPHSATIAWTASASTVATYNVYRYTGACSSTSFGLATPFATAVAGLSYTDATVTEGNTYCYAVTAVTAAGVESALSNAMAGTIPSKPAAPVVISVTVK